MLNQNKQKQNMPLTGTQLIGNRTSAQSSQTFQAINPTDGLALETSFHEATEPEVNRAVELAEAAYPPYREKSNTERAAFLEQIAEEIMALGDELIERAMLETALPEGRLQGERGRTVNQLKLFAQVVREGSWVDARIDTAQPDRSPIAKVDIRSMLRPLGPVAIFGASNFPLAFSVAGGDTASALAAACPVVVKGHPAHPGTSELVGGAILYAALKTDMPEGVFSMVQGTSHEVGGCLVKHPLIQAVGFTGSFRGGKALFDLANQRAVPIPVFAEMGSSNPVFILPGALKERGAAIASGLAGSVSLGVGQFCTNPGLVFLPAAAESAQFQTDLSTAVNALNAGTMLTEGIRQAYESGAKALAEADAIRVIAKSDKTQTANGVPIQIFYTELTDFAQEPTWAEEVFGPSSLLVQTPDKAAMLQAAAELEGHLTATVHGTEADFEAYAELFPLLERKVGRVVVNGFPTGVEVCHSMVHGGPFPATTAPQTTSVGTLAIRRFARPVCFQNYPAARLPEELKDGNPLGIWRMVDGERGKM
jgi:alpha-ketoglutaric semialdehyde dehydrogenase